MRLPAFMGGIVLLAVALGPAASGAQTVDAALVLAIDVSASVGREGLELQRRGAAQAMRSAAFAEAVSSGRHHAVAISVFEWSGIGEHVVILPWTRIRTAEEAGAAASRLEGAPRAFSGATAVGDAIYFAIGLMESAPPAERRVIDVSGDGRANAGWTVRDARDAAVAAGIVVNGLPVLDAEEGLEEWYRENVQGGERSFTMPARGIGDLMDAFLAKLLREIS